MEVNSLAPAFEVNLQELQDLSSLPPNYDKIFEVITALREYGYSHNQIKELLGL